MLKLNVLTCLKHVKTTQIYATEKEKVKKNAVSSQRHNGAKSGDASDKYSSTESMDLLELDRTLIRESEKRKTIECEDCKKNTALLSQILISQSKQANDLRHIINLLNRKDNEDNAYSNIQEFKQMTTKESIAEFNLDLEDLDFFKSNCGILEHIGGKDIFETTRRILSTMITNELALTFNWCGGNQKNKFSSMGQVIKLILCVVRRNPLCKKAMQSEIETIIKAWLRTAGDREGGRSKQRSQSATAKLNGTEN